MSVKNRIQLIIYIFLFHGIVISYGQNINRNVLVVKPYEPSLSDIYKISVLPKIDDTVTSTPDFNYSILPVKVDAPFELKPINAAKMVGTPLEKLYKSYLKIGIGNYFTTLGEYNINSMRSKEYSWGAYFYHKSSSTNIKLENDDKVPGGYSINKAIAYGSKYFTNSTLSGQLKMENYAVNHYGYNTEMFEDTFPSIRAKDIRQIYNNIKADIQLFSTQTDSSLLNYSLDFSYDYLWDKFENKENRPVLHGNLSKMIGSKTFGTDLKIDYVHSKLSVDTTDITIVGIEPYFSKKNPEFEFLVGGRVHIMSGESNKLFLIPRGYLQINVVENVFTPYMGIDGNVTPGTYSGLKEENPFINPGSKAETMDELFVYAGLKGVLNSKSGYNLMFSYNSIKNLALYVNDSTGKWDNRFKTIYDDVELTKISAEIYYDPSDYLNFLIKGGYSSYKPGIEEKAWHKPAFDLTFTTRYSFHNKILVNIDLITIGSRYAKPYIETDEIIKLDPVFDINLGIEYRYSKVLSIYLDFYNLSSSKYFYWNQYPNQRLNLLAGFSYKL